MERKLHVSRVVIDPVSPEFNRGSFCYLPYLLASSWYGAIGKLDVDFRENFCAADVDCLPEADEYYIALWSHPQIEHVQTLVRFLPEGSTNVFGYAPLIKELGLPLYVPTEQEILDGMFRYIRHQSYFSHILLSDCDMHLSGFSGQVYPMFTSYGCPNGCAFCPSTANQPKRLALDLQQVHENLLYMDQIGHTNIHFTDEDFFFDIDRAAAICQMLRNMTHSFQLIALASRHKLWQFIAEYGAGLLQEAGFKLLEVGLETADDDLSAEMGKSSAADCARLSLACPVPILWLTLTFFPGETIYSLNATGNFLRKYGQKPTDLCSRIVTNGTYGGLGQFFQLYEGTKDFTSLMQSGKVLTKRPLRLLPSFLPDSFLQDRIQESFPVELEDEFWFKLYRVLPPAEPLPVGITIEEAASLHWPNLVDGCVALAICARLEVIR